VLRHVGVHRQSDAGTLVIIGEASAVVGEWLVLDVAGAGGAATLRVRVAGSRPVVVDGAVRYALSVILLDGTESASDHASAASEGRDTLQDILASNDLVGVLARDVPVHVMNVSGSGCLVETVLRLDEGATATLRVGIDGQDHRDPVRITWCHRLAGSGETWRVGAEFLWTDVPDRRSLRRLASRLQQPGSGATFDIGAGNFPRPM
jgi:hypothetical protein